MGGSAWASPPRVTVCAHTAAAARVLTRLQRRFPRLFKLVVADGLYARADFITFLRAQRLHALIPFKREQRVLMREACAPKEFTVPFAMTHNGAAWTVWDIPDGSGWETRPYPLRVVISAERRGSESATWAWITTLPHDVYRATWIVPAGHIRWHIENQGFNALSTCWHADHVHRHTPRGIEAGILLTMLAYVLFQQCFWHHLNQRVRAPRGATACRAPGTGRA